MVFVAAKWEWGLWLPLFDIYSYSYSFDFAELYLGASLRFPLLFAQFSCFVSSPKSFFCNFFIQVLCLCCWCKTWYFTDKNGFFFYISKHFIIRSAGLVLHFLVCWERLQPGRHQYKGLLKLACHQLSEGSAFSSGAKYQQHLTSQNMQIKRLWSKLYKEPYCITQHKHLYQAMYNITIAASGYKLFPRQL